MIPSILHQQWLCGLLAQLLPLSIGRYECATASVQKGPFEARGHKWQLCKVPFVQAQRVRPQILRIQMHSKTAIRSGNVLVDLYRERFPAIQASPLSKYPKLDIPGNAMRTRQKKAPKARDATYRGCMSSC